MKPVIGMKLKDKTHGYILTVTEVGPYFAKVTHENGVFYSTKIALMAENFEPLADDYYNTMAHMLDVLSKD